ncbi:HAD family hydrolase [Bacillus sp. AK128]
MGKVIVNGNTYEVDGILFDKDGTLLDFGTLWIGWSKTFIDRIVDRNDLHYDKNELAQSIGFSYAEGSWDPMGPIAIGSLQDIISILTYSLYRKGMPWNEGFKIVNEAYVEVEQSYDWSSSVKPIKGLLSFLEQAAAQSIKMGVVTSDDSERAKRHLEILGIDQYFSAVIGHDSVKKGKPFPEMVYAACEQLSVKPERTITIGDSNGDMLLGKNGNSIGCIGIVSSLDQPVEHLLNADEVIRDYTYEFMKIE